MSKTILTEDGGLHEDIFESDNIASRRVTGRKLYDPSALLTTDEIAAGLGYEHPRVWPSYEHYLDATEGLITVDEIPEVAPRRKPVTISKPLARTDPRIGGVDQFRQVRGLGRIN